MQRHPFDTLSFLAGAVFSLLAVTALAGPFLPHLRPGLWGPVLVIVAGVGLLASLARPAHGRAGDDATDDPTDDSLGADAPARDDAV